MKAMVLRNVGTMIGWSGQSGPLEMEDRPVPEIGHGEVLIKVSACGVCRTELDQIEGRIAAPKLPIIPGHQPVGIVARVGPGVTRFAPGDRAGAAWIFSSCGRCKFCLVGQENLCEDFMATGSHADGGYAEYFRIAAAYAIRIPDTLPNLISVAPFMCSGAIGYRSLKLAGLEDGMTLGLYGFGSANHLVLQMAKHLYPGSKVFVLSRNPAERRLALDLGADWADAIEAETPEELDRAIDTTPAWQPVLRALENLERGGRLVINAIQKEDTDRERLLALDYAKHLWLEKDLRSVANVTRADVEQFVALASEMQIEPVVEQYRLDQANEALGDLRAGRIRGSKVLVMEAPGP